MKIAFINGSPKNEMSASKIILKDLRKCFSNDVEISDFHYKKNCLSNEEIEILFNFDALIFAFPLYVDGVPSHLLNCLCQIEETAKNKNQSSIFVYSIVNCGFFEGHQNRIALDIMKNWCIKAGFTWGQGIGVGGGGALMGLESVPIGNGPKKNLGDAFNLFVKNISSKLQCENIFISINFPRIMYKFVAEIGWRYAIKKNGLKTKDLHRRL